MANLISGKYEVMHVVIQSKYVNQILLISVNQIEEISNINRKDVILLEICKVIWNNLICNLP